MADGQPLIITELEGEFRSLSLKDSTMPRQGVEAGARQRKVATRYPGSSKVSTQMLGTEEDDIVFEGELRDSWTGIPGGAVDDLNTMRALLQGQRLCSLEWGTVLVRRGYVSEVIPRFDFEGVIGYRLMFTVVEADEADLIVTPTAIVTNRSLLEKIQDVINAVEDVVVAAGAVNTVGQAIL